ncbi:MAG: hypothetical protein LC731_04185, partial [Acidobacteria bacterium]|nr:hypothetical protein [Acidobacteriota bacterium]
MMNIKLQSAKSHSRSLFTLACIILALSFACRKDADNENKPQANSAQKSGKRVTNQKFINALPKGFTLPADSDEVGLRVLADYGAVFVARGNVTVPPVVIFDDDAAVSRWQSGTRVARENIGGINVELQEAAMKALKEARAEAEAAKLTITPRGTDAARRSYGDTVKLWQSRVNPGLTHWVKEGRMEKAEAERIRALSPREQVPEILRLERDGLYFNTDFSKSILYSVAAPGTSQHLSMLAFDVKEHENSEVRAILARHGWFQTITSDTPHFTFLGTTENELPAL